MTQSQQPQPKPQSQVIIGPVQASPGQLKAFLRTKNFNAPSWIIDDYFLEEGKWYGIRPDILVCQMFLETGYLLSFWSGMGRYNLCGLGVTGETSTSRPPDRDLPDWDYDYADRLWKRGVKFVGYRSGVWAHYAHMWAYVGASVPNPPTGLDHRASALDPRFHTARAIAIARGWKIKTLDDLDGRWAVPGGGYGTNISNILTEVLNRSNL